MDTTIVKNGVVVSIIVSDLETAQRLYPDCEVRERLPEDRIITPDESILVDNPNTVEDESSLSFWQKYFPTFTNWL